jgi:hypothetical protein
MILEGKLPSRNIEFEVRTQCMIYPEATLLTTDRNLWKNSTIDQLPTIDFSLGPLICEIQVQISGLDTRLALSE